MWWSQGQIEDHWHMVGGFRLPAASGPKNFETGKLGRQIGRYPDVVESTPTVRSLPILGAIAPPSVKLLIGRHEMSGNINPISGGSQPVEPINLDRCVRHHGEHILVRPDVVFQRRDVQVTNENSRSRQDATRCRPLRQFVEKLQFMLKFWVLFGIRNIAAGWHIEAMQVDTTGQSSHDVPAVPFAAPIMRPRVRQRHAR